jgi:hypothetical protein
MAVHGVDQGVLQQRSGIEIDLAGRGQPARRAVVVGWLGTDGYGQQRTSRRPDHRSGDVQATAPAGIHLPAGVLSCGQPRPPALGHERSPPDDVNQDGHLA